MLGAVDSHQIRLAHGNSLVLPMAGRPGKPRRASAGRQGGYPGPSAAHALDQPACPQRVSVGGGVEALTISARPRRHCGAVGQAAVEVVGVAGAKHPPLGADGDLDLAAQDDAALLRTRAQQGGAGVGAGGVALMQICKARSERSRPIWAKESRRAAIAGHFDQIGGVIEDASARRFLRREELGHLHRDAVEHLLQRADGRAGAVLLDQRDGGVETPARLASSRLAEPVCSRNRRSRPPTSISMQTNPRLLTLFDILNG